MTRSQFIKGVTKSGKKQDRTHVMIYLSILGGKQNKLIEICSVSIHQVMLIMMSGVYLWVLDLVNTLNKR
jgi:hypothetical protein